MFARALIVLLLVLNVGVAAWWVFRPAQRSTPIMQPQGVAPLRLLSETPRRLQLGARIPPGPSAANNPSAGAIPRETAPPAQPPGTAVTGIAETAAPVAHAAAPAAAPALQCISFGPFASADAAAAAHARLQLMVQRSALRTLTASPARGWRVYLPPLPSDEAAKAMAQRIADAGFGDYLILHNGDDANAIALGRYGNQATARRRAATLRAAGFTATRAEPVGGGEITTWVDIAAAPAFDAAAAQTLVGAPGRQALDCMRMQ